MDIRQGSYTEPPTKRQEPHGQQPSTRICIPYIKGIGEQIRKICNKEDIQVTFRSRRTLRTILTKVKPSWPDTDIKGVVYRIPCKDCDETYIGETGRTLKTRLQEHKRDVRFGHTTINAVAYHAHSQLHQIDWDNAEVVDQEQQFYRRRVKEAIHIRTQRTSTKTRAYNSAQSGTTYYTNTACPRCSNIFYQPAAREGRLVLRLLCGFRVCIYIYIYIYICASTLITCAIITSCILLPCDLVLLSTSAI